ncbi:NAD(P)-binding domain-containing protein [Devosia sp. WQ 349]|nr:NAD(P)-binding domain-containing protein [Devosia sp. WQ 349K1]MBK1793917.1 NAD(P)-binding domain-containing protein [Devosia sp. WQ 349K1]
MKSHTWSRGWPVQKPDSSPVRCTRLTAVSPLKFQRRVFEPSVPFHRKSIVTKETIGIIGAGEVGTQIARAAILAGYSIVIANSRGPETLRSLVTALGPNARASTAAGAAAAGDFVMIAAPLKLDNKLPVTELAGKIVLDTNNYMLWRDGDYPQVTSGAMTIHELRQQQLPLSRVASAFTHVQAPRLLGLASPEGTPNRHALAVSSNFRDAVSLVTRLYNDLGFDAVDNSPLFQSWRVGPGQPAWEAHAHQTRTELIANIARADKANQR